MSDTEESFRNALRCVDQALTYLEKSKLDEVTPHAYQSLKNVRDQFIETLSLINADAKVGGT